MVVGTVMGGAWAASFLALGLCLPSVTRGVWDPANSKVLQSVVHLHRGWGKSLQSRWLGRWQGRDHNHFGELGAWEALRTLIVLP